MELVILGVNFGLLNRVIIYTYCPYEAKSIYKNGLDFYFTNIIISSVEMSYTL